MSVTLNIQPLSQWIPDLMHPLVISGPCSAETEEQVHITAEGVAKTGKVRVLRAGIWKPRTRPNSFEGVGEKGLKWLVDAAHATGLLSATEVANGAHVEACLTAGVDILWIGARTTVNPFSVQEIADAVRGLDIPVFVKNPVNADLQLWIGAIERVAQAGITKIAAIHRGFSSFSQSQYRNPPQWDIPIELKRQIPNLDIICDPSHICGNRHMLQAVAQRALDLEMSGLMIESHIDPDNALSDAKQQVTPEGLAEILDGLVIRQTGSDNPAFRTQLVKLRERIDMIDDELVQRLAARMALVKEIGDYKKANNVTILQMDRWNYVIRKWVAEGRSYGLDEDFLMKVLQAIHKESIRVQTERGI